jgi:hypothetical protein
MALTVSAIQAAESDEALTELLSGELQRLLPKELLTDADATYQRITELPRGLRAMAGMHFFDVSMALDDIAWHFGNQHDERALQETLDGLRELELSDIAACFEKMWDFMKPHIHALQSGDYGGKDFSDWLEDIGAQSFADPMDKLIWAHCDEAGKLGLLASWPLYARKYPERCVVAEMKA